MSVKENDEDIWVGDMLGRKEDGVYLQRFIENAYRMDTAHKNSFVLNINSEWGTGKTWFLDRFSKQLRKNHPVVYFDAWKNDFTKDPLMSFIAIICKELEDQFSKDSKIRKKVDVVRKSALKFIKPSLPVLLAALARHYTGIDLIDDSEVDSNNQEDDMNSISDAASTLTKVAATEAMRNFYKQKEGIDEFIDAIKKLVDHLISTKSSNYLPICIFIDELDRCRPTYAIELLESVKHLFSIGGLFFIIATDTRQLSHSIKAVYGERFNSTAYLKRFFYTEYALSDIDYDRMGRHLLSGVDFYDKLYLPKVVFEDGGIEGYFSQNSQFFELTPREQEQAFTNLKNCVFCSDFEQIHFSYILFLLCLKLKHEDIYMNLLKIVTPRCIWNL